MDKRTYIVGIGEVLWDLLPAGKQPGGAPANFAYHIAQFGLKSIVVSAIGDDTYGNELQRFYDSIGLNHSLSRVDYPTGTVAVNLDAAGVPQYDITRDVAWDHIPFTPKLETLAAETAAVCFGSLAQRSPESRATILKFVREVAKVPGTLIIFDGNLRQDFYDKETIRESLALCNILKINEEELEVFCRLYDVNSPEFEGQCKAILQKFDLNILIVTCGAVGSYVFTPDTMSFQPTPHVEVDDTVGAGDSFTAAFVASILQGRSICDAHKVAVRTSVYVCQCHGAMPVLPPDILSLR